MPRVVFVFAACAPSVVTPADAAPPDTNPVDAAPADAPPAECESLTTAAACNATRGCRAVVVGDHTDRNDAGQACFVSAGLGVPTLFQRCIIEPSIATGDYVLAIDPASGRCLGFPSGTYVPGGWARCETRLAQCPR